MIEEQALVKTVTTKHVVLQIESKSSCSSCDAKTSCGTSSLSQLFGKRPSLFTLPVEQTDFTPTLAVGDHVMVGLDEQQYIKASALIYLLPIAMLFFFAIVADQLLAWNDLMVTLFGFAGLWFGFKWANKQAPQSLLPQIIRRV